MDAEEQLTQVAESDDSESSEERFENYFLNPISEKESKSKVVVDNNTRYVLSTWNINTMFQLFTRINDQIFLYVLFIGIINEWFGIVLHRLKRNKEIIWHPRYVNNGFLYLLCQVHRG